MEVTPKSKASAAEVRGHITHGKTITCARENVDATLRGDREDDSRVPSGEQADLQVLKW